MATIRCHIVIHAPRERLFMLTQDYAARTRWDPFHRDYRLLDGADKAVGTRVWYRARNGMTMTVRYVSYLPPERVAMTMVEGPWMFRAFSGSWVFKALAPDRTELGFHYHFVLRPAALDRLLGRWVATRLEKTMNARLAGLKHFSEAPPSNHK